MNYKLRWGSWTWIPALLMGGILGTLILLFSWDVMGEEWHNNYYVPMLGYYVLVSICQSHYFKSRPEPNYFGFVKQGISIVGAIVLFYLNEVIMASVFGIPDALIMPGHFTFILLGFFFYGWDDFMFKGALSGWMKIDAVKALFWLLFNWAVWYVVFAWPDGIAMALGSFDPVRLNWFLASMQWVIMMSMMTAITWREYLETIRFPNNYARGLILLTGAVTAGFTVAMICYLLVNSVAPALPEAAKWHHVLYMGTYPLIPIILSGIYSNHFNHIKNIDLKTVYRTVNVVVWVVLWYLTFRLIVTPSGIFGVHPWYHHFDLVVNFTVSIIPLTHHWFNGKLGFVVPDDK